ncbi:helix-turn-helix domain-containing protein [Paenibacillus sepulcri]|uniref:Helix-turn-helix domain-containing protein n=1 Tax=Paenibacillus sepulcri TaxID=359917 RepID=A0ABS7C475_9BACL|nr:helix-turn-helix domain-containing protein [Paenibacillus sepulcri]
MKIFEFYRSKKYLQRVMFSIMISMVIVLTALSVTNTYILERSVKNIQEESNLKVLSQIQYNLSYMNEIITHLSNFVYRDNLLISLMFNDGLPKMDMIRSYRQMTNILESSSFLHSMVVYNHSQSELYGTTSTFLLDGGIMKAKIRNWLLDTSHTLPTSRLIPMSLETENGQIDTFAFIVTDSLKPFASSQSAIILFIKSDWVFDSLKKMNIVSSREQGQIYIKAQDGRLYSSNHNEASSPGENQTQIGQLLSRDMENSRQSSGFVIGDIGGSKSMVTYLDDSIRGWTILYVQSYGKLMEEVTSTRVKSLVIAGIFLLLSIGLSIWLSYKLYHPIENMLQRIHLHTTGGRQSKHRSRDELHLMSDQYLRLSEKLQEISSEQIVSKYYIRKFLTDSQMFSHNDMQHLIEKHELNISLKDELLVCVLRIDRYAAYDRNTKGESKKLYSFAMVNIAQEIMSGVYPCEAVEVRGDQVVLIVSRSESDIEAIFERVTPLLRDIQQTVKQYYNLSLSCGISEVISQFPFISAAYNQALQLSSYSIVKGSGSIITSGDIRENLAGTQRSLPDTIEKKLSEALKKGQMTAVGNELEKAFSLIAAFPYDDMLRAVSNLGWIIKNATTDIMNNRVAAINVDMDYIQQIPQESETLEEMYISLLSICAKICEGQKPSNMERNEMVLETIKELIEQKYADINLSQQSIASTVKLTSAYIGKLFKDSFKISITEYMNDVRLRHAQILLQNDSFTIAEVMEKCGYANQSYFFRLFKGKFGSTPKEYRMKKSIS